MGKTIRNLREFYTRYSLENKDFQYIISVFRIYFELHRTITSVLKSI